MIKETTAEARNIRGYLDSSLLNGDKLLNDREITSTEKLIYIILKNNSETKEKGYCTFKNLELANLLGYSTTVAISRCLTSLEKNGYLKIERYTLTDSGSNRLIYPLV